LLKQGVAEKSLRTTVIDEERSLAKSAKPGPSHAIRNAQSLLRFRQEDIGQNLFVTSLSQWL